MFALTNNDNTLIERVESFNYLGIMLNETLSWKSHIEMVGKKISKVTGILYRLRKIFPENVLFTLYNSLIISYINYGLLLWEIDCHKLEILQKKVLRFMTNSSYIAHTAPLFIQHGVLRVTDMYKLKLLKFTINSHTIYCSHILTITAKHLNRNLFVIYDRI